MARGAVKAKPGDRRLKAEGQTILRVTVTDEVLALIPEAHRVDKPEAEQREFLADQLAAGKSPQDAIKAWRAFRKDTTTSRQEIVADLVTAVVTGNDPVHPETRTLMGKVAKAVAGTSAPAPAKPKATAAK